MTTRHALPGLRPELRFSPVNDGGEDCYIIEDPVRHLFFRIGREEYLLAITLDRARTMDELLAVVNAAGNEPLTPEQAQAVIRWLDRQQLLRHEQAPTDHLVLEERQRRLKQFSRLNLVSFKLPLFNPDPFLDRLPAWMVAASGLPFLSLWLLLAVAGLATLAGHWQEFSHQAAGFFSSRNLLITWLIWSGLKLLHEFLHALVTRLYGGRVPEAGILFILFIPLTYVEATSSWSFPSRWQRIHVALAGILAETMVAWVAILVWVTDPASKAGFIAHNTVLVAGISSLLFNANPLMRFDGYYVLSDLVGIPNLYGLAFQEVKGLAARWFLGIQPLPLRYRGGRRTFIRIYGVAVFIWRILVVLSLGYLASMMAGGLGIFVTMGAVLVWIGMPVYGFLQRLPLYRTRNPHLLRHLSLRLLLTLLVITVIWQFAGWRRQILVPAVVEYEHQVRVRAPAPGFVRSIETGDGAQVRQGELLLLLDNPEISASLGDVRRRLRQLDIRIRLAHSRDRLTDFRILRQQRHALEKEAQLLENDMDALRITAPADGLVVAPDLDSLKGTFLRRGMEILWIISPGQKHLVGAAAQDDIDSLRGLVGRPLTVDMRAAGAGTFMALLERVAPAATMELPHPALAALYGGPLDVRQQAVAGTGKTFEQRYHIELFRPVFRIDLALPATVVGRLREGQRAWIHAPGERITPGQVLGDWWRSWLKRKQQRADSRDIP